MDINSPEAFNAYREKMNDRIIAEKHKVLNRFWSLDGAAYEANHLDAKTKEMLGLVASLVLRCDDCIKYHLGKCAELNVTTNELMDIMAIGNLVGGSICIPHTRRAIEYWDQLHS